MRRVSQSSQVNLVQDLQFEHLQTQFQDLSERVKINLNYHVLLNKSAIQVFNCQNNPRGLKSLKNNIDCNMIQKLNLSKCNVRNFSQFLLDFQSFNELQKTIQQQQKSNINFNKRFTNLKQLILQNNYIQKIPQNICTLESLLILKLNRNQIRYIPYLGTVSHFQIKYNPVKQLSILIKRGRIVHFQMDWVDFIVQRSTNSLIIDNKSSNTQYFMQLLNSIDKRDLDLVNFDDVFQVKIKNKSEQYKKRIIAIFFNKALNINFCPFFQYLKTVNNVNFNQLKFNGKLILEKVLQQNYQHLIPLFMQKKTNLNSNDLYFQNICLACRYSNLKLFKYLMTMKTKKMIVAQHQQFIRMQILYSFDLKLNSHQILTQIIQNSTKKFPEIFSIPNDFTKKQSQCIGQALVFIITNEHLYNRFDFFNQRNFENDQLYLQFAVHVKNILLLKLLLFKVKINPFLYNFYFKTARYSKGSLLGKKILFKVQKRIFNCHFLLQKEEHNAIEKKKQSETFLNIKKDVSTLVQMYLQKYKQLNFLKQISSQQIKLKELQNIYFKIMQQMFFKQKDPIHLKKSNSKMRLQIQKNQKQEFKSINSKIKKNLFQKLQIIQKENQIISMETTKSKKSLAYKTRIKNQLIQYDLYQNLLFTTTDFTNVQPIAKQKSSRFSRKSSESIPFCNNQNYNSIVKGQQDKSCGNFICLDVNQIHKDECVYYS